MSGLTLTLKVRPKFDVDATSLGGGLARATADAANRTLMRIVGSDRLLAVGDLFDVKPRDDGRVVIEGSLPRFHHIATGWKTGELVVEGDVGSGLAAEMRGGSVWVRGSTGDGLARQMRGGVVRVTGNAGDEIGGPLVGRRSGMSGGRIRIDGQAGHYAGYRMRRGTILVNGDCGDLAGCGMVAGTIAITGGVGGHLAEGMRRGTVIVRRAEGLSGLRFTPPRQESLSIARLLANDFRDDSPELADALTRPVLRSIGDLTETGAGEVWQWTV